MIILESSGGAAILEIPLKSWREIFMHAEISGWLRHALDAFQQSGDGCCSLTIFHFGPKLSIKYIRFGNFLNATCKQTDS
ncbi:hypothetical protein PanWU01x14_012720 [Parasponia andersonii]|uniref:Uncharacterized protein n=1 Tax=Parasponia andersonii TaxID=3476 RepID=A0A2P5E1Z7_PARAD|nr:hypothetical protein PanWU01x14_012720 [Parasponia andersonii]